MQLTISEDGTDRVTLLEVADTETVENLMALIEVEFGTPLAQQALFLGGRPLSPNTKLSDAGAKHGDMIIMKKNPSPPRPRPPAAARQAPPAQPQATAGLLDFSSILGGPPSQQQQRQPGGAAGIPQQQGDRYRRAAEEFLHEVRANPYFLGQLEASNPRLAEIVRGGQVEALADALRQQDEAKRKREEEQRRRLAMLEADPFNIELQREVEQAIQQENINENLNLAHEHMPEAFASVYMLYIDCEVNGVPMKAFVDSGAQMTIMSKKCAERCNMLRLVDARYQGVARGVGTSNIVGRVHMAQIKIGGQFFPCSLTILEDDKVDFLFGLDMLKRHQCCIDLKQDKLFIGDTSVRFLGESEIKDEFGSAHTPEGSPAGNRPGGAAGSGGASTSAAPPPTAGAGAGAPPAATQQAPPSGQQAQGGGAGGDEPMGDAGGQGQAQTGGAPVAVDPLEEQKIQSLMALGVSREQAEGALRMAGGNAELAASLLLGG
mmetsp:Transcript_36861/g.72480  ORF Transcript_36861/g.72480 Transcript_36861/m.72480 type:complete len:491 (+) Transcript_36861:274-1746(+)